MVPTFLFLHCYCQFVIVVHLIGKYKGAVILILEGTPFAHTYTPYTNQESTPLAHTYTPYTNQEPTPLAHTYTPYTNQESTPLAHTYTPYTIQFF